MLSADAVQGQPFYEVLHYIESSDGLYGTASGSSLNGDGGGGNHGDGGGVVFRLSLAAAFLRGECNEDGAVDVADAACSLNYLFAGAAEPGCLASLNANGDSEVNVVDPIALLNFLFGDGPAPVAPFPDCGPGTLPADAQLGCADPPNCQ